MFHKSVLLEESIKALAIQPGGNMWMQPMEGADIQKQS